MRGESDIQEYRDEIRKQVCSHCIQRPPGGPPCAPLGMRCGLELHLADYLDAIHDVDSPHIEPYLENIHDRVCRDCEARHGCGCPCPLDYLLTLVVQAVETVDLRRAEAELKRIRNVCCCC